MNEMKGIHSATGGKDSKLTNRSQEREVVIASTMNHMDGN